MKKILMPKGSRGLWMEPVTQVPGEHEILLQPGLSFKIIDDGSKPLHLAGSDEAFVSAICNRRKKQINFTVMQLLKEPAKI